MRSAFFGLNVSTQGLYTAQTALDVVSHNISNAALKGYSRQYADIKATRALPNSSRGMVGTGAEVLNIKQYRSTYLDNKFWNMSTDLGQYEIKEEMLGQLELLLQEPSDSGYSVRFSDVFDSLQELANDPGNDTVRLNFVDNLSSFATYFNKVGEQLNDYQNDANFGVKTSVERINFYAAQIAAVNNQIQNMELNGSIANDLRDERVNLIDELSKIINIDAKELEDINGKKTFKININGQSLVDGNSAKYLEAVPRKSMNNAEDVPDLYDIYWAVNDTSNFDGSVVSGGGTNTIVVDSVNRTDIPTSGAILIDGVSYNYTDALYNDGTGEMTFTLDPAPLPPAVISTVEVEVDTLGRKLYLDGPTVTGELKGYLDIRDGNNGDNFTGTVSAGAGTNAVTVTGISRNDIPESGYIKFDGLEYKYDSIVHTVGPPENMTFNLDSVTLPPVGVTTAEIGKSVTYKGIPYYIEKLNNFIRTVASRFNELHEAGEGGTGVELFAYNSFTGAPPLDETDDFTYNQININNFSVNPDVLNNLDNLLTSATVNAGESANDILVSMMNLRHDVDMFSQGEPDNYMQGIISELAIDTSQAKSFKSGQENLTRLISNQRESYSGVDLNEETADMIKYQQAYNLSAKMISVMDEIYDVTINQLKR